jgi:hypothetical protein
MSLLTDLDRVKNRESINISLLTERGMTRHPHLFHVNTLANVQTRRHDRDGGER